MSFTDGWDDGWGEAVDTGDGVDEWSMGRSDVGNMHITWAAGGTLRDHDANEWFDRDRDD